MSNIWPEYTVPGLLDCRSSPANGYRSCSGFCTSKMQGDEYPMSPSGGTWLKNKDGTYKKLPINLQLKFYRCIGSKCRIERGLPHTVAVFDRNGTKYSKYYYYDGLEASRLIPGCENWAIIVEE